MRNSPETSGDGNYTYHYSREERLKRNPRVKAAFYDEDSNCHTLPCFFKRNRGLMFLLIDVTVLLLLFWGYSVFFRTSKHLLEKDGLTFSLHAYESSKGVLVSLIVRSEKQSPQSNEGESIPVIFRMGKQQWEGRLQLPEKTNSEQAVRISIPEPVGKEVVASFFWKGKSYTLTASIR
ncbi:MAG: hypothetical protein N2442_10220 [Spirochaetes bacterium]|nr:hypothetical protein [Spirochaetota bacterium]